jgi:hypothetical protein
MFIPVIRLSIFVFKKLYSQIEISKDPATAFSSAAVRGCRSLRLNVLKKESPLYHSRSYYR